MKRSSSSESSKPGSSRGMAAKRMGTGPMSRKKADPGEIIRPGEEVGENHIRLLAAEQAQGLLHILAGIDDAGKQRFGKGEAREEAIGLLLLALPVEAVLRSLP